MAVAALAFALGAAPAWGASGGAKPKLSQFNAARLGRVRAASSTGIVQAVRPHGVVVRQLDGRKLFVGVGAPHGRLRERIARDARRPPARVRGRVHLAGQRHGPDAARVQPLRRHVDAAKPGTVQSISADAVVVTGPNGGTVTIAVAARTQVFLNGESGDDRRDRGRRPARQGRRRRVRAAARARAALPTARLTSPAWRAASCWSRTRRTSPRSCGPTSSRRATASSAVGSGAEALQRARDRAGAPRRARPQPAGHATASTSAGRSGRARRCRS